MRKIISDCKNNWKTSLAGLFIAVFTILLLFDQIQPKGFIALLGGISSIIALLSKDQDK